jgi:ribonuclease E
MQPPAPLPLDEADLEDEDLEEDLVESRDGTAQRENDTGDVQERGHRRRRRRGRRRGGPGDYDRGPEAPVERAEPGAPSAIGITEDQPDFVYPPEAIPAVGTDSNMNRRRRGRRGGRGKLRADAPRDHDPQNDESRSSKEYFPTGAETDPAVAETDPFADLNMPPAHRPPDVAEAPEHAKTADVTETRPHMADTPKHTGTADVMETRLQTTASDPAPQTNASNPAPRREYEVVNQTPETPRQGWWKRLIQ